MKKQKNKDFSSPKTLTSELKERQSVRASFRLTEGCIDAINIVATQMGIKQKSLFDHLAEDIEGLKSIARELKHKKIKTQHHVQKTYVISRKSLASFDETAMLFNTPRDALVERSIQRLLPIIKKEREKHEKRKKFLLRIKNHFGEGEKILGDIQRQLGDDDPIISKYALIMSGYKSVKDHIEKFINKSKNIEKFDSKDMNP